VLTENTSSVISVCSNVNDVKNSSSIVAGSQNCHTSDITGPCQYSGKSGRPVNPALICDVSPQQQSQRDASNNFSRIFQTSDLELTDADLEFDPK